jgi:hypothetical protein
MIRQAHTYLVSAMSGAALIAVAIAVFVVLVSAQVFRDWPIGGLGGDADETAPVSRAEQVRPPVDVAGAAAGPGLVGAGAKRAGRASGNPGSVAVHVLGTAGGGGVSGSGGSGGRDGGAGTPSSPAQVPTSSTPPSNGSAGAGSASGGGNGGGASGGAGSGTAPSTAGTVTSTVNDTVTKVDEAALGGTLHESGVTPVTEGVVEGVAGPESPLGKAVDETTGAVGNLLPGNR